MKIIESYLTLSKRYSPVRFIIELVFIAVLGKLLIGFTIILLLYSAGDFTLQELPSPGYATWQGSTFLIVWLCILAPLAETLLLQWIPISLLQKISSRPGFIVAADALLFAVVHLSYGLLHTIAVLPAGLVLAWSFFLYQRKSITSAFWITAAIHSLYNLTAVITITIPG